MSQNRPIVVVDDDRHIQRLIDMTLTGDGRTVKLFTKAEAAIEYLGKEEADLVILDLMLPGMSGLEALSILKQRWPETEVLMITAHGSVRSAVEALKAGAFDYVNKPFDPDELSALVARALERHQLKDENVHLKDEVAELRKLTGMIGGSRAMKQVQELIAIAAEVDVSVLILGESGVGKELVAHAIHDLGTQSKAPFIAVNCAAIPESMLEGELFGHRKGAFTGAVEDRMGKFEAAGKGTIFLDEIGEMDPGLQAKLLRVLESRKVVPLGSHEEIAVRARVVAATNQALEAAVAEGRFRADLYYRLSTFPILVPPLRERREDIPALVEQFVRQAAERFQRHPPAIDPQAMRKFETLDYPGNIRELKNLVDRAVLLAGKGTLLPGHVAGTLNDEEGGAAPNGGLGFPPEPIPLRELEKRYILHIYQQTGENQSQTARVLGIDRTTLINKLKRYESGEE
ncbi:MAG: hypothetical protein COX57_00750 [Alphaproteobacteria bacterium CG_4_10_14_0_2_um_filter_63_37]|nr:MAG: hypothetical protein AUJ55_07220 [Proteobacteria bacterium CG1_02_64_396]PJA25958.1 MAG: hypothetical protein COX57_00750 [Alphaproteobacteria bacterium CG_4_10_14_0_2_um_filter_63_37]